MDKFKVSLIVENVEQKTVYIDIHKISDIIKLLNEFELYEREESIKNFYTNYVIDKCKVR